LPSAPPGIRKKVNDRDELITLVPIKMLAISKQSVAVGSVRVKENVAELEGLSFFVHNRSALASQQVPQNREPLLSVNQEIDIPVLRIEVRKDVKMLSELVFIAAISFPNKNRPDWILVNCP